MSSTAMAAHLYNSDPQSGAGNCTCGRAESNRLHFHDFRRAHIHPDLCVCGFPPESPCHWWG